VPFAKRAGGGDDRRAPRADARGSAGDAGQGEGAVADLELDRFDGAFEGVGGDLGEGRPGAGADVGGADLNEIAAVVEIADPCAGAGDGISTTSAERAL
jgi:hypothetical protein